MNTRVSRRTSRKWNDLTDRQKTLTLVLGSIQLSLAATAWADLAKRSPAQVHGSKPVWSAVIAVSFFGPVLYFVKGIRR
ncbi:PLDc N-terminal domain-containing protein [Arthrobacter sp. HLT1-21]